MQNILSRIILIGASVVAGCSAMKTAGDSSTQVVHLGSCNPAPCATVSVGNPPPLPAEISEEVKESITARVTQLLYAPVNEDEKQDSLSRDTFIESVDREFTEYLKVTSAGPQSLWSVTRTAAVTHTTKSTISIAVRNEGYLGGAHGFLEEHLLMFDVATGKQLGWSEIMTDESRQILTRIAEAEFRRARKVAPYDSLKEKGFEFEGNAQFALPTNFALTQQGLRLYYNTYEVAPYVMGPTDFTVPLDTVSALLRPGILDEVSAAQVRGLL